MALYDFLAPGYDPILGPIYAPFRRRALELLGIERGATVLEVACGTGLNFPQLVSAVGPEGKIIGVDIAEGMLRRARRKFSGGNVTLLHREVTRLTSSGLRECAGVSEVDAVVCTFGFTAMKNWEEVFRASFALLRPGGVYFIHDIFAERRGLHVRAFELATLTNIRRRTWEPLRESCEDFRFSYIDPSAHIFAGRLFVARGVKRGG